METEEQQATNQALKSISYSIKNSYQLARILKDKGFSEPSIQIAIQKLIGWGYVNDKDWIRSYIENHKKKHHGPRYIQKKLLEKQIPNTLAFQALQVSYTNEEECYWIRSFLDRKSTTIKSHKDKSLILKKLLTRGFHYESILSELSTIPTSFSIS